MKVMVGRNKGEERAPWVEESGLGRDEEVREVG